MQDALNNLWTQLQEAHHEVISALPLPSYEDLTEGPGVLSGLKTFADAINWSEPFFKYLLAFHALTWIFVFVWSRNSANRTAACLGLAVAVGLSLPYLNDLGAAYHENLFVQEKGINYFDANGTFLSAMLGAPIIVLALLLQVKLLYYVAVMMVKLKRAQLKHGVKGKDGKLIKGGGDAAHETAKTK